MKTFGYLNAHVKIIYHLNVLRALSKFHKPNLETTLVTHYLLSQYVRKKGIDIIGENGVREVCKDIEQIQNRKVIQTRLRRVITVK